MSKSKELAKKIRLHALEMTHLGGSSHIGSILSIADILAVLYEDILVFNSKIPKLPERDRFILSKGHSGAGVYAVLAEKNFFPVSELKKHYSDGSKFSGHVSHKGVPGVEFSTGSLGHGLSISCGLSLSAKLNNQKHKIFCLISDGECDEGSNWEAILLASHHELDNLIVIIDKNGLQSIKSTNETLNLEPFRDKWISFGWKATEIDGHNNSEILNALKLNSNDKPHCIIAKTIKGKGVSFMENNVLWHYRTARDQEYINALKELES